MELYFIIVRNIRVCCTCKDNPSVFVLQTSPSQIFNEISAKYLYWSRNKLVSYVLQYWLSVASCHICNVFLKSAIFFLIAMCVEKVYFIKYRYWHDKLNPTLISINWTENLQLFVIHSPESTCARQLMAVILLRTDFNLKTSQNTLISFKFPLFLATEMVT